MRAPRSVRLEDIRQQADPTGVPTAPILAAPGVTVYVSKYRRYRVQITSPQSYVGPDGRKNTGGKRYEAQFDEGIFRNDHHDPAVRALFDEELKKNKYFGTFGSNADYWLASDQHGKIEGKRIESALATLKSLPKEVVSGYVAQLQHGSAEDHTLDVVAPEPGAKTGKATRPIPPPTE
jgi:hypothetical protein